ncbi:hypothetical protein [Candidatus Frankia nodulisporulans]|uniref:hypothetical protein n=1 Tax=Candidatus Frankia nodulisporulans TaxID=2060052 RepID=UPI00177C4F85|nr:hypothetical protein [Candidatus Frankia nodulisporulans]
MPGTTPASALAGPASPGQRSGGEQSQVDWFGARPGEAPQAAPSGPAVADQQTVSHRRTEQPSLDPPTMQVALRRDPAPTPAADAPSTSALRSAEPVRSVETTLASPVADPRSPAREAARVLAREPRSDTAQPAGGADPTEGRRPSSSARDHRETARDRDGARDPDGARDRDGARAPRPAGSTATATATATVTVPEPAAKSVPATAPEPVATAAEPASAVSTPVRVRPVAALAVLVGAIGAGAGSVMPWSSLSDGEQVRQFSGVEVGDGRVVLVLAVGLAAVALSRLAYRPFGAGLVDIVFVRLSAVATVVLTGLDRMYGPPTLASFRAVSADAIIIAPRSGLTLAWCRGSWRWPVARRCRFVPPGRTGADGGKSARS